MLEIIVFAVLTLVAAAPIVAFALYQQHLRTSPQVLRGHPRSIFETRRAGLA